MINSRALILAIGSNHQDSIGNSQYNPSASLLSLLPPVQANELITLRRRAFSLLRNPNVTRWGLPVRDYDYNEELAKDGKDFGGDARVSDYLPAVQRFTGRFYGPEGLSADGADPSELVERNRHHFLIVTPLYGLVNVMECIQQHNLSLLDSKSIREIWVSKGTLTRLLLAYATQFLITRIFDLTGLQAYRSLIHWDSVADQMEDGVLHAFSKRNAGDATMPAFGRLVQYLLNMTEKDLLEISRDWQWQSPSDEIVVLTGSEAPPEDFPREIWSNELAEVPGPMKFPSMPSEQAPDKPRLNLPMTSGKDGTIFGPPIRNMRDLPKGARELLANVSCLTDIAGVFWGRFTAHGQRGDDFSLRIRRPTPGSGRIEATLHGPGKPGGIQEIEIRVRLGCETRVYQRLLGIDSRIKAA